MSLFEIDDQTGRGQLRVFGAGCAAVLGAAGFLAWPRQPPVAAGLWAAAAACAVLAAARPAALRWAFVGLTRVTWPVGLVVSWAVLALAFYGVVTPIGLALRLAGRDALGRRFDRTAETYWAPRPADADPERYFRQY
jgi:hypothetical protein